MIALNNYTKHILTNGKNYQIYIFLYMCFGLDYLHIYRRF